MQPDYTLPGSSKAACGIAVMAKASAPGRTKTRLVPPLTHDQAAAFNTAFLKDVAANLLAAGRAENIAGYMAFGPPGSEMFFADILPEGIGIFESWLPDFGACLRHAVATLFAEGHAAACVLNADSPTLPTAVLVEAASALARPGDRAVLGRSTDGGYYLLGMKTLHGRLFEDIAWSTEIVADQTLARAAEMGLPVHMLPTWYDVDDAASLAMLTRDLDADAEPDRNRATHTRALLATLAASGGIDPAAGLGSGPEVLAPARVSDSRGARA